MGHVRDLPKSKLGVDVDEGLRAVLRGDREPQEGPHRAEGGSQEGDDNLHRDRPRSRRRGDRLAPRGGARRDNTQEDPPADVQRDHQEGRARGARQADDDRQEDGGRAAGAPRPRSARRLQDQPAALGQGPPRPQRRPRAVGRAEAGVRSRARDRRVRARGVLEHHGAAGRLRPAGVRREAPEEGRREHQGRQRGGVQRRPRRPEAGAAGSSSRSRPRNGRRAPFRRSSPASCSRRRASR